MSILSEVKSKVAGKADKDKLEEIFRELDVSIRASYETRLKALQDESTAATEVDQKMLIAVKIDELASWKNELVK